MRTPECGLFGKGSLLMGGPNSPSARAPNPLLGQLATSGSGQLGCFSAHALVAIHTQEFCRLQLVGDHFAGIIE